MKLSSSVLQRPPAMEVVLNSSPATVGERFFTSRGKRRGRLSQLTRNSFTDARLQFGVRNNQKRSSKLRRFSSSAISQEEIEMNNLDEDEDEASISDDDASTLSLSVKPDRNMALLDDYEMEELDFSSNPNHRSGYVAVVGKPNVGKSTLANQMIGQKLSIVTDKPPKCWKDFWVPKSEPR